MHNPTSLQWGHALSGMDTWVVSSPMAGQPSGFNGAMPFQAWILGQPDSLFNHTVMLQWGHALSGMDTCSLVTNLEMSI